MDLIASTFSNAKYLSTELFMNLGGGLQTTVSETYHRETQYRSRIYTMRSKCCLFRMKIYSLRRRAGFSSCFFTIVKIHP